MNSLNRETTIPKRKPEASSFPTSVFLRIFSSVISSVPLCLCGEMCFIRENPRKPVAKKLLALELCHTFLQKRRRTFLLIFRRARNAEQNRFQIQPFRQLHLRAFIYRFHRILHSQRRVSDDFLRD